MMVISTLSDLVHTTSMLAWSVGESLDTSAVALKSDALRFFIRLALAFTFMVIVSPSTTSYTFPKDAMESPLIMSTPMVNVVVAAGSYVYTTKTHRIMAMAIEPSFSPIFSVNNFFIITILHPAYCETDVF